MRHSSYRRKALARIFVEMLECRILLTPALSSLPGANHTIYLDFDGQEVRGTSWNSVYNDGQPIIVGGFGYDDATITSIWTRVAEDFAPFNVNVTTVEPPISDLVKVSGVTPDTRWGIRVIVTPDQSWLTDDVGFAVGGVAYVGSFNWAGDTPCWSFNPGEYAGAETISHEAGHTLGLSHDGGPGGAYYYGDSGVAPIMGVGWGQPISRWSKGEYPGATQKQDDLAIITTQNGFGYRADTEDGQQLTTSISGIIQTNADVDTFSFYIDDASAVSFTVAKPLGYNLSEHVRVFHANGEEIVDRSVLFPGTYYVTIEGVAGGYYSDYGSIGQYTLSITIDPLVVIDDWGTGTLPVWSWTNPGPAPEPGSTAEAGAMLPYSDCVTHEHENHKKEDRRIALIEKLFSRGHRNIDKLEAALLSGLNERTL